MTTSRVRQHIVDFLRRELIGPDAGFPAVQLTGEEILRPQDPPRLRYGAGVLFPAAADMALQADADEDDVVQAAADLPADDGIIEGDDGTVRGLAAVAGEAAAETDYEVNRANDFLPSAMGLSALIDMPAVLQVAVTAGRYEKEALAGQGWVDEKGRRHGDKAWWRVPIRGGARFDGSTLLGGGARVAEAPIEMDGVRTGLAVHVLSRPGPPGSDGRLRLVTVTLVNRRRARNPRPADDECFFQCRLDVDEPEGQPCFIEYPERPDAADDEEEASLRLLYRNRRVFAVGHGCAPDWTEAGGGRASGIWSESLPMFEVSPVLPREIPGLDLSMVALSEEDGDVPIDLCRKLASEYRDWIDQQEVLVESAIPLELRDTAGRHLARCRACLGRIEDGIGLIISEPMVRRAFALMNRTMLMQQVHYEISSQKVRDWKLDGRTLVPERPYEPPSYEDLTRRWRPFQLAFILTTLRSIADPESEDRRLVDLIWFPTGGGKTEAYLGLSAFSILLRRLQDPANAGTVVLMRYTLRLLTTQQYQRAASLICACESLRRSNPALGTSPITIGLWVGGDVTPNDHGRAVKALQDLLTGQEENPFVVLSCPWCGARMGPVNLGGAIQCRGYRKVLRPARVIFRCDDAACPFSGPEGLPLKVIDEDIYKEPPALLVGTVDKFAMLPWRPESRSIFGLGPDAPGAPPDLVIQDELHLISGPLGSMVGHYETVIDALVSVMRNGRRIRAKTIASTATISRADEQVRALYGRPRADVVLFPPQGLSAGDSFFAEERTDKPGRLYVGVFASALPSHQTAQVRVMAALLQSIKTAPVDDPHDLDPYWTMVGYFNSLRELGHASTMIKADIREYLNAVWDRKGLTGAIGGEEAKSKRRFINRNLELTSRIQTGRIPEALQQLFIPFDGQARCEAIDVCFATNMIQVGLDVPRLSLMTIVGQPKTTSEYIQASSRVGREEPGLVVTNYNPGKPRDRSHFEHFRAYHQSIYRYVEPTSVTPFAVPVRDRALHALVVTLARFWGPDGLRIRPDTPPDDALVRRIRSTILDQVDAVDPAETKETRAMIEEIFTIWRTFQPSRYGDFGASVPEVPLMYPSGKEPHPLWQGRALATPTSMRNVDASCDARVFNVYPLPDEA